MNATSLFAAAVARLGPSQGARRCQARSDEHGVRWEMHLRPVTGSSVLDAFVHEDSYLGTLPV